MVLLDIYVAYILFNVCLLFTVCLSLHVFVCFVFLCSMGLSLNKCIHSFIHSFVIDTEYFKAKILRHV